ncbi:MAG: hypothetical protein FJY65_05450 [Calditrichaeota bacterium]|nr:hypothetical protein [Calditrichota bacterium]
MLIWIFLTIMLFLSSGLENILAFETAFKGYARNSLIYWKPQPSNDQRLDNILNLRLNLRGYINNQITVGFELKNRLFTGDYAGELQQTATINLGRSFFKWRRNIIEENEWLAYSEIDRAWLDYQRGNAQLTLGRQRIAWGTNLVWNPIDIFNPSSPLDFDNEEKPGGDAVRAQYFLGDLSRVELAMELQHNEHLNWAALFRSNLYKYDVYLMLGERSSSPIVGLAWAGQISGAGLRGECAAILPDASNDLNRAEAVAALSGDFTLKNGLYVHSEALLNTQGATGDSCAILAWRAYSEDWLTPAHWSLFGEIGKDLHPLVRLSIAGILNPIDNSYYLGPSLYWSALTNLDLSAVYLYYKGLTFSEFGGNSDMGMLKARWAF